MAENMTDNYRPPKLQVGGTRVALRDFPFLGAYAREHRRIAKELRARKPSLLHEWKEPDLLRAACFVSPLIQEYAGWPAALFLPKDDCDAILWPIGIHSGIGEFEMRLVDCGVPSDRVGCWAGRNYGEYLSSVGPFLLRVRGG